VEDSIMSVSHAQAGEPISVLPAAGSPHAAQTVTLIKTASLEVIRLVLPAGKELAPHHVPGEITLQCLSGRVTVGTANGPCELSSGMLVFLSGGEEHSVLAHEPSTLLVTILLSSKPK
jgi:quercetin dioxygenase-like cupin family protein